MDILEEVKALHTDRDALRKELSTLRVEHDRLAARAALLEENMRSANSLSQRMMAERDHYMRQTAELMAVCSSVMTMLSDFKERIDHGLFRPNGAAPQPLESVDPIPSFLVEEGVNVNERNRNEERGALETKAPERTHNATADRLSRNRRGYESE